VGGGGLVGDCGLLIPGGDPGFQVTGGVLKKFHKKFGVFCVKNQDFMQKNHIFPILGRMPGAPPFHLITDKGNNSYEIKKLE
jgi:hypothetical protein